MVTAFVVTLTMALLFAAGLGYDAGRLVDARIAAADVAAGAARAGAQHTVVDAAGRVTLDESAAREAAAAFVADPAYRLEVDVSARAVTVSVSRSVDMTFLRLFGLGQKDVRATHTAEPVEGS
jgi:hypothetical protein